MRGWVGGVAVVNRIPVVQSDVMALGVVKFYQTEKGWGAITSDALPPGLDAWVHYSVINDTGFRELQAGDLVEFDFARVDQDSFRYRATSRALAASRYSTHVASPWGSRGNCP